MKPDLARTFLDQGERGGLSDLPKTFKGGAFRLRVANPVWGAKHGVGDQPLGRPRCALACLFASALAALGAADASPAQHQKPLWQHRSKAAEAEGRKDGTQRDAKQSNAARLRAREAHAVVPNVPLPVARPAAASLPPDLATTKVAIELIREGKWEYAIREVADKLQSEGGV
jgi:hypothetical protein